MRHGVLLRSAGWRPATRRRQSAGDVFDHARGEGRDDQARPGDGLTAFRRFSARPRLLHKNNSAGRTSMNFNIKMNLVAAACGLLLSSVAPGAQGAEIKVLASGAIK